MIPEITFRAQMVAIIVSSLLLLTIVYAIVRAHLALRSSLGWVVIGLLALAISIFPQSLIGFAHVTGIGLAANALFLFTLIALLIILFGHSLHLTKLHNSLRTLTQQLALHELENRQQTKPDISQASEAVAEGTSLGDDSACSNSR
jgi:hypothetical protein